MPLGPKKVAVIQVARQQLGMAEDDYRAMLRTIGGVSSSKELDETAFEAVMVHLSRLGFRSDWNRRNFGYRPDMATPRQVAFIRNLWGTFTDGKGTDETLGKWLEAKFGISAVRFVPSDKAQKVIGALQAMTRGKARKAA